MSVALAIVGALAILGWMFYFDERCEKERHMAQEQHYFDLWIKNAPYTRLEVVAGRKRKPTKRGKKT